MVYVKKRFKWYIVICCCLFSLLTLQGCKKNNNKNYYTITFLNHDLSVLKIYENIEEGVLIEYDGETPLKQEDEEYTYSFVSWNKPITHASSDETYIAIFIGTKKGSGDIGDTPIGDWDDVR